MGRAAETDFVWHLCYKGTRDGNSGFLNGGGGAFHRLCNNRGRSFFVAKTQTGKLFGGYTSLAWVATHTCEYRYDPDAFMFSLTNNFKHEQTGQYAASANSIFDCTYHGPTFGGGSDFYTDLRGSANV